jgi:hypothetical protein
MSSRSLSTDGTLGFPDDGLGRFTDVEECMEIVKPAPHLIRWFLKTFGYGGITLPPFGIYILAERLDDAELVQHEMVHWSQYERMGAIKFYWNYLAGLVRYGYKNHPMEVEARDRG